MGYLIDKIKTNKEERNALCNEIDLYINTTNDHVTATQDFLDDEYVDGIKKSCSDLKVKIDSFKPCIFVSKRPLKKQEKNLKFLCDNIPISITNHNTILARNLVGKGREIIGEVEGKFLDDQQMLCIVRPARSHLVIAGAGTGKTTTIIGKIKYLLNTKKCEPKDILVLSFTNASAEEMRLRINKETKNEIDASTFHKLGLNIINTVNGITPKITQIQLSKFVKEQIAINMRNPKYLWLMCNYFLFNHRYNKSEFEFKEQVEYDEYLKMNPPVTLGGDKVKSYGEMDIANFLFQNGIEYKYEQEYEKDTRTEEKFQYYPDFYLPDYGIYIEYFGINEKGEVPAYFKSTGKKSPSEEYRLGMEWKRNLHETNGTTLIETFAYEKSKGELLINLEKKLRELSVEFKEIAPDKMWDKVSDANSKDVLTGVAELMGTVISLLKSDDYTIDKLKELCLNSQKFYRNTTVVELIRPIYDAYQKELKNRDEIDFNDMINLATRMVRDGKYVNSYKYVIVDEYQDISRSRFNLLKALRDSSEYNLFCVGDDWQSIYRFTGSDMDYILNFSKYWGRTELDRIETTYRFTDSLIDISGNFVMQNPSQIRKRIRGVPSKIGFAMGEIKALTEETSISFMVSRLSELPQNSTVFFIGRYTFDSKLLSDCPELDCKYDNVSGKAVVVYPNRRDLKMEFLTAHKSKGLQADYVFIINNKDYGMGFPSKIEDDPVIGLLLDGKEDYPFAEERRLFYVALTRAKIKTYLVTVNGNESCFASEMERKYEKELRKEGFTCPLCGGHLEKKSGPYGAFFGCSNYKRLGCKFTRKITKKSIKE